MFKSKQPYTNNNDTIHSLTNARKRSSCKHLNYQNLSTLNVLYTNCIVCQKSTDKTKEQFIIVHTEMQTGITHFIVFKIIFHPILIELLFLKGTYGIISWKYIAKNSDKISHNCKIYSTNTLDTIVVCLQKVKTYYFKEFSGSYNRVVHYEEDNHNFTYYLRILQYIIKLKIL